MMTKRNRWGIRGAGLAAVGLIAAAISFTAVLAPAAAQNAPAKKDAKAAPEPAKNLDVLIFKTGRVVEGIILEETASQIKIKIVSKGGLSVETSYDKSEVLEIQRGKGAPIDGSDPAKDTKDAKTAAAPEKKTTSAGAGPSVYVVNLTGELGRDVARTSVRDVMADIKKFQPDVLIFKVDMDFKIYGMEREKFTTSDANAAFYQLETVRELQTMIIDDVRDDPNWTNKPRFVMWVKRAMGGPAFLPFIAPEIYYTPDGHHGGIGYLERTISGGDKVVHEKLYGARLGRAEGLALKGGHSAQILRAMARADYVLSVNFVGGQPEFHEDTSGEILLTDDAKEENKDNVEDVVRFRGNDVLMLDAPLAYRLGLSKGTAETLDDLLTQMGIDKGYSLVAGRADDIIKNWGRAVSEAEFEFRRLFREYGRAPTGGANYDERTRNRGTRLRLLENIKGLLDRFGEAINPAENGAPDDWKTRISIWIEEIKTEQRLDRR
jgi:hypothetical protein